MRPLQSAGNLRAAWRRLRWPLRLAPSHSAGRLLGRGARPLHTERQQQLRRLWTARRCLPVLTLVTGAVALGSTRFVVAADASEPAAAVGGALPDAGLPSVPAATTVEQDAIVRPDQKDPSIWFPVRLFPSREEFVGSGMRLMLGIARVYQIGLYVDVPAAQRLLRPSYANWSAEQLEREERPWHELRRVRHSLVMHIVREADGKHMMNGFDRALSRRIRHATKKLHMPDAKTQYAQFVKYVLSLHKVPVGAKIRFAVLDDGNALLVQRNDEIIGYVEECPALCYALDDMFLGAKPVSAEAKHDIAQGLARILADH